MVLSRIADHPAVGFEEIAIDFLQSRLWIIKATHPTAQPTRPRMRCAQARVESARHSKDDSIPFPIVGSDMLPALEAKKQNILLVADQPSHSLPNLASRLMRFRHCARK